MAAFSQLQRSWSGEVQFVWHKIGEMRPCLSLIPSNTTRAFSKDPGKAWVRQRTASSFHTYYANLVVRKRWIEAFAGHGVDGGYGGGCGMRDAEAEAEAGTKCGCEMRGDLGYFSNSQVECIAPLTPGLAVMSDY